MCQESLNENASPLLLFLSHSKSLAPALSFAARDLRAGTTVAWVPAFLKHFWHQTKDLLSPPYC